MAIENAKTLNVRIKNKYDSYENWAKSGIILEAGEIAIAYTTVNVDIGNGKIEQHPELLMKVGNNTDTFANLPWLSAKAADVAAWAKAANKPTYAASEITGIADYIAEYVEDTMGISVDTNDVFKIVKVDDYNYKLQTKGKNDADTAWADVADSVIVIPNDTAAIEALEDLVGDTKVATQISNAITELNLANTYETKGEAAKVQTALDTYKTSNDKAVADNKTAIETEAATARAAEKANADAITAIKDGTTIDSFADVETALEGKQAVGDYATKTEAQGYANAKDEAIAAAKKAGDDAQSAADTAQGEIDALEAKIGTVPENQTVMGIITNIQENAYDDTTIKADIKANSDAIDALETKVGEKPVAEQISTAIANEKLAETYAAKTHTHAIADVTGLSDAIADAKKAGTDAQGEIDALEAKVGTVDDGKTVVKMIADAQAAATYDDTELAGRVTDAEAAIDAIEADYLKAADKEALQTQINTIMNNPDAEGAINSINEFTQYVTDHGTIADGFRTDIDKNKEDIAALDTLVGDKKVSEQISTAVNPVAERVTTLEGKAHEHANKTVLDGIEEADVTAWDAKVDDVTAAADSGLKATRTGNTVAVEIDDSLTFIFDCGNSGVVAE